MFSSVLLLCEENHDWMSGGGEKRTISLEAESSISWNI
jgi:hypothetical protein